MLLNRSCRNRKYFAIQSDPLFWTIGNKCASPFAKQEVNRVQETTDSQSISKIGKGKKSKRKSILGSPGGVGQIPSQYENGRVLSSGTLN